MPVAARRTISLIIALFLAPTLIASSCSDDGEDSPGTTESEVVPEVDALPVDSAEPDPGLGVDGIELDGPQAPQEGDGSTPDEPSFEPSEEETP